MTIVETAPRFLLIPAALERRAQKYLATHRERSRRSTDALGLEEDLSSYRRGIMREICFGFSLKMAVALGSKQDSGLRTNVEQPTKEQPQKTELPGTLRGRPIPASIPTAIQNAAITPGQSSPSSEAKSKVLVCYVNKDTRQRVPAGKVAIELLHELPVLDLERGTICSNRLRMPALICTETTT